MEFWRKYIFETDYYHCKCLGKRDRFEVRIIKGPVYTASYDSVVQGAVQLVHFKVMLSIHLIVLEF